MCVLIISVLFLLGFIKSKNIKITAVMVFVVSKEHSQLLRVNESAGTDSVQCNDAV